MSRVTRICTPDGASLSRYDAAIMVRAYYTRIEFIGPDVGRKLIKVNVIKKNSTVHTIIPPPRSLATM
jgi:hypothetical protein